MNGVEKAEGHILKLLIVDDNEQNRYMLQVLLEGYGYQVTPAGNGAEALEAARRNPPDMIITDILMPGMDGFALCREWKKDERLRAIPFVFYTATYTDPKDEEFALSLGAERFIVKPQEPDVFMEMVQEVFENYKTGRLVALREPAEEEAVFFKEYNEVLIRKLENKLVQLEETNRVLEREITERKQAQEALQHYAERLRMVISNVPVVLFALDREGAFTLLEGRGLEVLGIEPGEHVGMSIFDVYGNFPDVVDNARCALAGEMVSSVLEIEKVALEAWWSPVQSESGEITGVIGVAIDVTERERLEERIQRQERLVAVGQLAGGIAHDFNNFLTTIMFYAQMLQRVENIPPDAVPLAEIIRSESQRAARLVQQVLDFSRRSAMETQPVDLSSFIEEAIGILQKTLPENVRLLTEVEGDEYIVNADPTRIQQVAMNLVLNARDAMPEGGDLRIALSEVTVRAGEESPIREMPPGEWVCLSIADTGTGMTEEIRSHIFEPFFTTKGSKGTGLGLAQVYGIVRQHRGHIDVDTKPGQGTTFHIYLPIYHTEEEVAPKPDERPGTIEGQGETILFVEDEEQVREAGRRVLELLGYRVLTASDGREALRVYQAAERIDLVLTDVVMPEMGGKVLIQELQRINPRVKILALTGYTMQEDMQELRREGLMDTVYKPLDVGTLGEAIRQMLGTD